MGFEGSRAHLGRWAVCGLLGLGCAQADPLKLCGQIPAGGCPLGRGGTCDDRACVGLYDCVQGSWKMVRSCSTQGSGGSGGGATQGGGGSGGCTPVVLDDHGETTGCTPDLQAPDCPAVAAETCLRSACLSECVDFFRCEEAGWTLVAFCDEHGELIVGER